MSGRAAVAKAGPHGYSHGWVKDGAGEAFASAHRHACPDGHPGEAIVPDGSGIHPKCTTCGKEMQPKGAALKGSWRAEDCCTPTGPGGKWAGPPRNAARCGRCHGTRKQAVCTKCGASGCDGQHDDCLGCDGTGKVTCPGCGGDGVLDDEGTPCPDCADGSVTCPGCGGTGAPASARKAAGTRGGPAWSPESRKEAALVADVTWCIRRARGGWSYAVAGGSGPGSAGKSPTYGKAREAALTRVRAAGGTGQLREWEDGPCTHGAVKAASGKARSAAAKSAGSRCGRCRAANRAAASFCRECGAPIAAMKAQAAALAKITADTAELFAGEARRLGVTIQPSPASAAWRDEADPNVREHLWKAAHGLLVKGA